MATVGSGRVLLVVIYSWEAQCHLLKHSVSVQTYLSKWDGGSRQGMPYLEMHITLLYLGLNLEGTVDKDSFYPGSTLTC